MCHQGPEKCVCYLSLVFPLNAAVFRFFEVTTPHGKIIKLIRWALDYTSGKFTAALIKGCQVCQYICPGVKHSEMSGASTATGM